MSIKQFSKASIPGTLYKYRDWSNLYHKRLISDREIYFASPSDFNDPFDGNIPVRWDKMTREDCVKKNMELLKHANLDTSEKSLKEQAEIATDNGLFWNPTKLAKERPHQLKEWDKRIGLFTLAADPSNILMWSHYSNNHRGFVVGFDTNSITSQYDFEFIDSIVYQEEYPEISGFDEVDQQFYKKFFYKSSLWEYEQEWRITKNHIENRVMHLYHQTIQEVIFGCKMNQENVTTIKAKCRKNIGDHITFFQATKEEGKFQLSIEEIG